MATFDAFALVPLIGQRPLLMIAGSRAVTSWMSVEAFQKAVGPKEVYWIEGASHVDLYDNEQYVGSALDKLAGFFADNLAKAASPQAPKERPAWSRMRVDPDPGS